MKDKKDKQEAIALSIGSPFASMISKFITYPLDTVKAKLQVSRV
jgi:hypothetical protein